MKTVFSREDEKALKRIEVLTDLVGELSVYNTPCELVVKQLTELDVLVKTLSREVKKLKASLVQSDP